MFDKQWMQGNTKRDHQISLKPQEQFLKAVISKMYAPLGQLIYGSYFAEYSSP